MKYRMGLDVGTNSLGWCILELDSKGVPCNVKAAGSRIFSNGRHPKSNSTLKAERRVARQARRRRDRFKQRQIFAISALKKVGLFPSNLNDMKVLQGLNPIQLRAEALTRELPPHHVGRVLFHLNQRRGFKSNRKDKSQETTSGKVSKSVRLLLKEMGLIEPPLKDEDKKLSKEEKKEARHREAENRKKALSKLSKQKNLTYGTFLWQRQQQGLPTRARDGAGETGKLYDIYPQRELYEDEFNKIWIAQAQYHSNIMTEDAKRYIQHAIFHQRSLKPQKIGKCSFFPKEDRTFRAMPSFQHYRIYQEVNNLTWMTNRKEHRLIDYHESRNKIVHLLETVATKSGKVIWGKIKAVLKKKGLASGNFEFNLETPNRKYLDGNHTSNLMQEEYRVGSQWHQWPLERQDDFIGAILDDEKTDEEVKCHLMEQFNLSENTANECLNAPLQEGTAALSLKAAKLLMSEMKENNITQPDTVIKISKENNDFNNPFTRAKDGELLSLLPYYGEAFQDGRHIIPGDSKPKNKHDDLKFFGA